MPAVSVRPVRLTLMVLVVSLTLAVGVKVAVQVLPSALAVSVPSVPLASVSTMSLASKFGDGFVEADVRTTERGDGGRFATGDARVGQV
ncbi:hypothetical protein D5038_07400 [Verminephrobacter aporrectodeae subsp. tuberculatae]|nr:hypothetical protein [Verminephrobacter aporrectodeae subsp. tuberculatae]